MMLSSHLRHAGRRVVIRRGLVTKSSRANSSFYWMGAAAALTCTAVVAMQEPQRTFLLARLPSAGGDVLMVGAPVKEKATGIMFPQLCNGMNLVGCGVRVKWGLVKVSAIR